MADDVDPAILVELRQQFFKAEADLKKAVSDLCPGPHAFVQHRDGMPPWCRACKRSALGYKLKEKYDS